MSAAGAPPPDAGPRLAGFVRRLVRVGSTKDPVVLLLDDAHWIDAASDELVREVAESVRGTRTLLLANFRPDYRPAWAGGSHYHQLALAPSARRPVGSCCATSWEPTTRSTSSPIASARAPVATRSSRRKWSRRWRRRDA
jgi:predicted ATPase